MKEKEKILLKEILDTDLYFHRQKKEEDSEEVKEILKKILETVQTKVSGITKVDLIEYRYWDKKETLNLRFYADNFTYLDASFNMDGIFRFVDFNRQTFTSWDPKEFIILKLGYLLVSGELNNVLKTLVRELRILKFQEEGL
jgi:hypothetical protein